MSEKRVVDFSRARTEKEHERKEARLDAMRRRFERAMGMEPDRAARRRAEKKRRKQKPRGW